MNKFSITLEQVETAYVDMQLLHGSSETVEIGVISKLFGFEKAVWLSRFVEGYNKELITLAIAYAKRLLPLIADQRSINALDVAERYVNGNATKAELDAAREAAKEAANDTQKALEKAERTTWLKKVKARKEYKNAPLSSSIVDKAIAKVEKAKEEEKAKAIANEVTQTAWILTNYITDDPPASAWRMSWQVLNTIEKAAGDMEAEIKAQEAMFLEMINEPT